MQKYKLIQVCLLGILFLILMSAAAGYLPRGIDWEETFRPASLALLNLESPYVVSGFFYPIWSLIPILPLAVLPNSIGRAAFLMLSLTAYAYSAYKLGGRRLAFAAFLLSPIVMHALLNANIDWMPLLGFVLPPQVGLFLVIIKPQVGWIVALYWFVEAWREGKWKMVFVTFLPVTIALLINLAIYGLWPLRFGKTLSFWWNASLWPTSIPVGLALIVAALRTRKIGYAMAAGPWLSPYVLLHSWVGALAAILRLPGETLAAVFGLWILVVLQAIN